MSSSIQDMLHRWLEKELYVSEFQNPSSSFFTIEENFIDRTLQTPAGTDLPMNVKFGDPKTSPNGLLSMDAAGVLTALKTGPYFIKTRITLSRSGSSGTSVLIHWVETSLDGGTTWLITGNAAQVQLGSAEDSAVFFDATPIYLPAGTKARSRMIRSSLGNNSGTITPGTLSVAMETYGLLPTPSAQLTAYRSNNWNYV